MLREMLKQVLQDHQLHLETDSPIEGFAPEAHPPLETWSCRCGQDHGGEILKHDDHVVEQLVAAFIPEYIVTEMRLVSTEISPTFSYLEEARLYRQQLGGGKLTSDM